MISNWSCVPCIFILSFCYINILLFISSLFHIDNSTEITVLKACVCLFRNGLLLSVFA